MVQTNTHWEVVMGGAGGDVEGGASRFGELAELDPAEWGDPKVPPLLLPPRGLPPDLPRSWQLWDMLILGAM